MRRQLLASIAVLVLALVFGCERAATDTGQPSDAEVLSAQLDTDPGCTDGDCPPDPGCTDGDCPPDPGCTDGDCPPDPGCTDGDCPPDPGCTDGDCPPDPGCTDEDCPDPPDPGCTDEDCPDPPDPGCTDEDCPPDPGCTDEDCDPNPPELSIDIKPGSYPNSWGCSAVDGALPVAIISAGDFDAMNVDADEVRFGKTGSSGAEEVHRTQDGSAKRHEEDVNGDGLLDLVFHFRFGDTGFSCDDIPADAMEKTLIGVLKGKTLDNGDISAAGELRLVKG